MLRRAVLAEVKSGDAAAAGHHQAAEAVGLLEEGQFCRVLPSARARWW